MSLKAFHILFVAICTLFCIGFGLWAVRDHSAGGPTSSLLLGIVSFGFAVALPWYGVWFLRKLRHVSFL